MKRVAAAIAAVVLGALGAAAFVASGAYNVGADDPHYPLTRLALEAVRTRSIAAQARSIEVPDLQDPARIRRGAGNYDAMCASCHLAPGAGPSELSRGLYPAPPELAQHSDIDAAQAFWVIKHGIKASGMPAWGKSMEDAYIWDLVAFLKRLPDLSPGQYEAEVAASSGHSHGGGETAAGKQAPGPAHGHDEAVPDEAASGGQAGHQHADGHTHSHGKPHSHPAGLPRR